MMCECTPTCGAQNVDVDWLRSIEGGGIRLCLVCTLVLWGLIAAIGLLFVVVVAPVCKMVLDVVMYAGSSEHRDRLQAIVREALLARNVAGRDVVLCGHSLGSVVALDVLRESPNVVASARKVTLITFGSPLRRLFHRFFPRRYRLPVVEADCLSGLIRRFMWINVYRKCDIVGTRLFGERTQGSCTAERVAQSKWYWGPFVLFGDHIGYFGDRRVYEQCRTCYLEMERCGDACMASEDGAASVTKCDMEFEERGSSWRMMRWLAGAIVIGAWLASAHRVLVTDANAHLAATREKAEWIRNYGETATGSVMLSGRRHVD
jgi:hypothetical protein